MSIISIIAAVANDQAIGKGQQLLCHLPADLKHFKSLTTGHAIIMGRKTFESLPKGALPHRTNIVLTTQIMSSTMDASSPSLSRRRFNWPKMTTRSSSLEELHFTNRP